MSRSSSRILAEIKQTRPFASGGQEAFVALLRTTDLLRRKAAVVVEPAGVTLQQYNVLRILRGAGEQGLPTLEIADRMVERAPGITRLLERLEKKQLVRRQRCPHDRRQVLCSSTPKGLSVLDRLDAPIVGADAAGLSALEPRELDTLIRLLDKVREAHSAATEDTGARRKDAGPKQTGDKR